MVFVIVVDVVDVVVVAVDGDVGGGDVGCDVAIHDSGATSD